MQVLPNVRIESAIWLDSHVKTERERRGGSWGYRGRQKRVDRGVERVSGREREGYREGTTLCNSAVICI